MEPIRARFAPSPTGRFHIGGARTALYDYLLAKKTGGQFILRIEDTDQKRYIPGAEDEIMQGLRWLGIEWHEGPDKGGPFGPYRQSARKEIYQQYAEQLIASGKAYYCFCTPDHLAHVRQEQQRRKEPPRYDGTCRHLNPQEALMRVQAGEPHVIRFKMPHEGTITVKDALRGEISFENRNLDDYIIVKSDGLALYHLAAIVDDYLMKITHVLRGSEWLPTFPLHAHICRALGFQEPIWVHLSVFLKPSGKGKMSKRDTEQMLQDGFSIFVTDLEGMGFVPEAVVNWVSLMGWGFSGPTGESTSEFFSMTDLIHHFDLDHLNPAPAAINIGKLDHFNGLHIRQTPIPELCERLIPFYEKAGIEIKTNQQRELVEKITPIIQERITTLDDAPPISRFFFEEELHPDASSLLGKNLSPAQSTEAAQRAYDLLTSMPNIDVETCEEPMRKLAEELGLSAGQFFGILRNAVTGQTVSPPLFESMEIIGKVKVLARIAYAIQTLKEMK